MLYWLCNLLQLAKLATDMANKKAPLFSRAFGMMR
jgi:hypothetical protein